MPHCLVVLLHLYISNNSGVYPNQIIKYTLNFLTTRSKYFVTSNTSDHYA